MILITLKMPIKPEKTDEWLELAQSYSNDVRAEPGNVFFSFSRSLEDENEYVCIEGFADDAAGKEHMKQAHVPNFMEKAAYLVSARPKIIYVDAEEVTGFVEMGEIAPKE
ncbi:putative quinol monooxygenase [Pseudonocardia sp.]|uniref:putative quinol monooxygenase n=1 Tax=Pseudonocardia sp. TaxID=60912 RepID=UPI003D0FEC82